MRNKREHKHSKALISHSPASRQNRIVQGHLIAVRDTDVGMQKHAYLEDQSIINRNFGEKRPDMVMNSLNKVAAWTTRACDWYNSERRIIFACKSEKQRKKWIKYFKQYALEKPFVAKFRDGETSIEQV